jgi:hypothetical protein
MFTRIVRSLKIVIAPRVRLAVLTRNKLGENEDPEGDQLNTKSIHIQHYLCEVVTSPKKPGMHREEPYAAAPTPQ